MSATTALFFLVLLSIIYVFSSEEGRKDLEEHMGMGPLSVIFTIIAVVIFVIGSMIMAMLVL